MNIAGLNWPGRFPRVLWFQRACPLCSGVEFKTAEATFADSLLRILALRPIRCVNCWRRYYWFHKS